MRERGTRDLFAIFKEEKLQILNAVKTIKH